MVTLSEVEGSLLRKPWFVSSQTISMQVGTRHKKLLRQPLFVSTTSAIVCVLCVSHCLCPLRQPLFVSTASAIVCVLTNNSCALAHRHRKNCFVEINALKKIPSRNLCKKKQKQKLLQVNNNYKKWKRKSF